MALPGVDVTTGVLAPPGLCVAGSAAPGGGEVAPDPSGVPSAGPGFWGIAGVVDPPTESFAVPPAGVTTGCFAPPVFCATPPTARLPVMARRFEPSRGE